MELTAPAEDAVASLIGTLAGPFVLANGAVGSGVSPTVIATVRADLEQRLIGESRVNALIPLALLLPLSVTLPRPHAFPLTRFVHLHPLVH